MCILGKEPLCQSHSSCSECIRSPGCAWCRQMDFLKPGESNERRCDSPEALKARRCKEDHVINPGEHPLTYVKNSDLSSDRENVVQLKPQNINITLRVGEFKAQTYNIEFKRAKGYPIDLYYLMDLSYSMKDDLEQIKTLGQKILKKLKDITETVRIGFGSFVDKEMLPYVSQVKSRRQNPCPNRIDTCQPAFSFKNVLPLTQNARDFEREVSKQKISGNLDAPEAGLDAIMQAVDKIRWGDVTRILVYTSDDTFHMAGDGRLGGVFQPHNGQCHLSDQGSYNGKDYPSVGHVSRVLQDNNIQLIFAVTEDIYPALSALIPQSVVGVLKNDSSNVVDLISEAYGNLSSTLVLEQEGAPKELDVSYASTCKGNQADIEWKTKGECQNIKHEKVSTTYSVRLNASACLKEPQTFRIKMQGINEEVKITVDTECHCNCGVPEKDSKHCNSSGTLSCGVCSCDEGYLGQRCECVQQSDADSTANMVASCRPDNSLLVCSEHGTCECGKCVCQGQFSGKFCECDDNSCEYRNGFLCNGKGRCKCGKCICSNNYTGSACDCSPRQDKCFNDKWLCSGQGKCNCNRCQCNPGFKGEHCSVLINDCMLLKMDVTMNVKCLFFFVSVGSVDKTTLIISISVSGIILIGIIIIIIYRCLVELYDIREYQNFVKAQKQTEWKEVMYTQRHSVLLTT
uniref:Integrin beta n=1 Tax=Cyprinus carpio TaxID=7962 RepID=A0A8C1V8M6_CYPCA